MIWKNMFKSILGSQETILDRSFWQLYRARCDFFICTSIKDLSSLRMKAENVSLKFLDDEEDPFSYGIVATSQNSKEEPFMFPLEEESQIMFCFDEENYAVDYFFRIDEELTILFKFRVQNKDFAEAGKFKEIVGRLMFQSKYKKPISQCQAEEQFYERIIYMPDLNNNGSGIKLKKENQKKREDFVQVVKPVGNEFLELMHKLDKDKQVKFASIGKLENGKPGVLTIQETGELCYEIMVLSPQGEPLCSQQIKKDMSYYVDQDRHSFSWVNFSNGLPEYMNFLFLKPEEKMLSCLIPALIFQDSQKKSLKDIISKKNSNWEQFYLRDEQLSKVDCEKIGGYIKEGQDIEIRFDSMEDLGGKMTNMKLENKLENSNPIQSFAQLRKDPILFVGKQKSIERYKLAHESLEFSGNLPIIKLYDKEAPIDIGEEIVLQEGDTRLLFTGQSCGKDEVYYMDSETGKVLGQYSHAKANDVARLGGKTGWQGPSDFYVLDNQAISRYDVRTKNGIVNKKVYKGKVDFNKIHCGSDETFAVGSHKGDIRMYNKLGSNAKNLIPSLLGDPIQYLDVSSTGDFILATCSKYLLLLPTFQKGQSGFTKTFLKSEKPQPRVLRLAPSAVAKHKLGKFFFKNARFDEKDQGQESLIVATADNFLAIWVLEDVLRNQNVTTQIKKIGKNVVAGQFRRNRDWLIAALKNDLVVQPTYSSRAKK